MEEFFLQPNFNPGGYKDKVDTRDHKWEEVGFAVPPFNWDEGFDIEKVLGYTLSPKNQGGSGSCGGQAWSMYAGVLEAIATKTFEERSAKFFYAQTFVPGGGSYGRDNAAVYKKQGAAREGLLTSYENGNPPTEAFMERSQDITDLVRQDAKSDISSSYATVSSDIDSVAQAIKANHGVIIGVTGSNNSTWGSIKPQPPKVGDKVWRHWIYAGKASLIDGVKNIIVLNSWGTAAGNNGWQNLDENYFNTKLTIDWQTQIVTSVGAGDLAIWNCWTHVFQDQAPPPPPVFHHIFNINLKLGDKGDEVTALQTALKIDDENALITGYYGNITLGCVQVFQKKYGIVSWGTPDTTGYGRVGPKTRAKLNKLFGQ